MARTVKSSSGLSHVRQHSERVITPPNVFVVGALVFASPIVFGEGHDTIRCGVTNGPASPGTLELLGSWTAAGPFVLLQTESTVVDPVTGLDKAEFVAQFARPFLIVRFVAAGAPGLTAAFELGAYFLPIDSPSDVMIASLGAVVQVQNGGGGALGSVLLNAGGPIVNGSFLAGGRDPAGFQRDVSVDLSGRIIPSPGIPTDLSVPAAALPSVSVLSPGGAIPAKFNILTAHVSAANPADVIRFEITVNHSLGAAFDTLLVTEDIVADAVGVAQFAHIDEYVKDGASGITLTVTNITSGAVGTVNAVWTPLV